MALPPLYGGPWLDLLIKDPLTYARHALRGNTAGDADFSGCDPDRPPVLLVHGFMGTRGALFLLESRLRADGFHVFSINLGALNIQDIRKSAFQIHLAVEKIMAATGGRVRKIDIIGHSMGGLIALYYLKYMGGDEHVRKLVTLGTPYKGTWISLLGVTLLGSLSPSTWQMLPGSYFLRMLGAVPPPPSVEWTSVIARYDALCPPGTARISPGNNYDLPIGHAGLVLSADVSRVLKRVLRRDHQPTTKTNYFVMNDGKWSRAPVDWVKHAQSPWGRRPGEERRAAQRREAERRDMPRSGRVDAPRVVKKAAKTARKRSRNRR